MIVVDYIILFIDGIGVLLIIYIS